MLDLTHGTRMQANSQSGQKSIEFIGCHAPAYGPRGGPPNGRAPGIDPLAGMSKVPTVLRDDGRVLTEIGPIGVWLARTNPSARLLPTEPDEEFRALSVTDYAVGTLHGQGFGRILMPALASLPGRTTLDR